jgi:hypothetical protein
MRANKAIRGHETNGEQEPVAGGDGGAAIKAVAESIKEQLATAAERGLVPAQVLALALVERFGEEFLQDDTRRRACGSAVAAVLRPMGYRPFARGKRIQGPLRVGTTFAKIPETADASASHDLLERLLRSLTKTEQRRAIKLLRTMLHEE